MEDDNDSALKVYIDWKAQAPATHSSGNNNNNVAYNT